MELALNLRIEDLTDKYRLFNLTDELLTLSVAHPSVIIRDSEGEIQFFD